MILRPGTVRSGSFSRFDTPRLAHSLPAEPPCYAHIRSNRRPKFALPPSGHHPADPPETNFFASNGGLSWPLRPSRIACGASSPEGHHPSSRPEFRAYDHPAIGPRIGAKSQSRRLNVCRGFRKLTRRCNCKPSPTPPYCYPTSPHPLVLQTQPQPAPLFSGITFALGRIVWIAGGGGRTLSTSTPCALQLSAFYLHNSRQQPNLVQTKVIKQTPNTGYRRAGASAFMTTTGRGTSSASTVSP
jgi:hypothetical protein